MTSVNTDQGRPGYRSSMNDKPLVEAAAVKFFSLAEGTQFAANGIVSRTLFQTDNFRIVLFGFAQGQELTEHTSTQQALVQILSGQCEFSIGDAPRMLKTGDLVYLPPHLPHAVKATEQFSMLLILFKSGNSLQK